jgi:hypothetical protein
MASGSGNDMHEGCIVAQRAALTTALRAPPLPSDWRAHRVASPERGRRCIAGIAFEVQ